MNGRSSLASADAPTVFTVALAADEHVYGLGARTGLIDRRGTRYTCWTTDRHEGHTATTDELSYAAPFVLIVAEDGSSRGVFVDSVARCVFDSRDSGRGLVIEVDDADALLVTIDGIDPLDVIAQFTERTGRIPLPPRWALGYHQARWGYESAAQVCDVARRLRAHGVPADVVQLDIDHMDGFRVFTWDPESFAHPTALLERLHALGFHATAVVDPGVKVEPGYPVYDEGRRAGYLLEDFAAYSWPGVSVLPDFTRADVRRWWAELHAVVFDAGVDGVICDMNEPSLRDRPLEEPGVLVEPPDDLRHADGARHVEVHNVYGQHMAEAAYLGAQLHRPDERPFVMSRAGYSGLQRFAATWTGDNASEWEQLAWSVPELVNMGVSGAVLCGADIGGFFGDCNGELLARWTQLGAWYPLARNHCAKDGVAQEPWAFGDHVLSVCRAAIEERYRLLPYLYTVVEEAARTGAPVFRGLFLHWPADARTHTLPDEVLIGRDLLAAPVLREGQTSRAVYLPSGRWYDLRSGGVVDGPTDAVVDAPLDGLMPLFARGGSIVPSGPVMQWSEERAVDPLTLDVYPDAAGRAAGRLYEDDGRTLAYREGAFAETTFSFAGGALRTQRRGSLSVAPRTVVVRVHAADGPKEYEVPREPD